MHAIKENYLESERKSELDSYSILDTLPESDYDNLTTIAAGIAGAKISLVSLLDGDRQWFKSSHGLNVTETPIAYSFCQQAVNARADIFTVNDARIDDRFRNNPLVLGEPHISFYAGVPLVSTNGLPLGALCVIDDKPSELNASQRESLKALSRQVMNLFELRRNKILLEKLNRKLEDKNLQLERFAMTAAHDLKSPLNSISGLTGLLNSTYGSKLGEDGKEIVSMIQKSSIKLSGLISGLLQYSKNETLLASEKSAINLSTLQNELQSLFHGTKDLTILWETSLKSIEVNKTALDQILINLVSNAIKYNDKNHTKVEIGVSKNDTHYSWYVKDNGPGIPANQHHRLFNLFEVLHATDRFGQSGNGIGLASVKKLIEEMEGEIKAESEPGLGSTFIFTIKK